jgi:hypothetical protein
VLFSDKCLKKWYHLPTIARDRRVPTRKSWIAAACLTGGFSRFGATDGVNAMRSVTPTNAEGKIVYAV